MGGWSVGTSGSGGRRHATPRRSARVSDDTGRDRTGVEEAGGVPAEELEAALRAAAGGEERAWRRILEWFGRRVFALVQARCRNATMAEEITQSVFATVAAKLPVGGYTEQGKFEAWLFRIAMNRVRDEARRTRRQAVPVDPEQFAGVGARGGTREEGSEGDELNKLRAALERLPEADREVVELRHHGELSFKQLAELLEEPIGTLLARHHRALAKLRALMEEDGGKAGVRKHAGTEVES